MTSSALSLTAANADVRTPKAFIDRLTEEFECALCGSVFVDPRVLDCQHCFCLRCLFSQALHDRGSHITIKCAFRCKKETTTVGDIRTLPKNPIVTSGALGLRRHLALAHLETHQSQGDSEVGERTPEPSAAGETEEVVEGSALALSGKTCVSAESGGCAAASEKKPVPPVDECLECEWCSSSSPSCVLCPYCLSRLCAECRGQFGEHQFLCVSLHKPLRSELPVVQANDKDAAASASPVALDDGPSDPYSSNAHEEDAEETARFPFLFSEADLQGFVHAKVASVLSLNGQAGADGVATSSDSGERGVAGRANTSDGAASRRNKDDADGRYDDGTVALADVELRHVTPVRIRCPLWAVQCSQQWTGFSRDLLVQPPLRVGALEIQLPDIHWEQGDLGAETLLFTSNMTRLAGRAVKLVNSTSMEVGGILEEMSSIARRELLLRNHGFQMLVFHVATIARMQVQVARNCVLSHLVRARLMEGIMGDMVANRYSQLCSQRPVAERSSLRRRFVAFLKTEVLLCERFDKALNSLDAVCVGVELILTEIFRRLREMAAHASQPAVRAHHSNGAGTQKDAARDDDNHNRLRVDPTPAGEEDTALSGPPYCYATRPGRKGDWSGAVRKQAPAGGAVSHANTRESAPFTSTSAPDPVDERLSDFTFLGQVEERETTMRLTTDNLLSTLEEFLVIRHWVWTYTNTTIRSCGLSDEDRISTLKAEESVQLAVDKYFVHLWELAHRLHTFEAFNVTSHIAQDDFTTAYVFPEYFLFASSDPSSPSPLLSDEGEDTVATTARTCFPLKYTLDEVRGGLNDLRTLRGYLVQLEAAEHPGVSRGFDTQTQLLNMMKGVIASTMELQHSLLVALRFAEMAHVASIDRGLRVLGVPVPACPRPPAKPAAGVLGVIRQLIAINPDDFLAMKDDRGAQPFLPMESDTAGARFHMLDFTRRDMALAACCCFGSSLVDAAHGVYAPTAEEIPVLSNTPAGHGTQQEAENGNADGSLALPGGDATGSADASSASRSLDVDRTPGTLESPSLFPHRVSPPLTPSQSRPQAGVVAAPEHEEEAFALPDQASPDGPPTQGRSQSVGSPVDSVADHDETAGESRTGAVALTSPRQLQETLLAEAATDRDGPAARAADAQEQCALAALRENMLPERITELIFAGDMNATELRELSASATVHDAEGCSRAAALFSREFRLHCDSAIPLSSENLFLPFYAGLYQYKRGVWRSFLMDAQTGEMYMEKPEEAKLSSDVSPFKGVVFRRIALFVLANFMAQYLLGSDLKTYFFT